VNKQENPLSNLFFQIEAILDYVVIKNNREAEKFESSQMAHEAAVYQLALTERDNWLLYTDHFTAQMFIEVNPTVRRSLIEQYLANPYSIPLTYRDHLLLSCRKIVLETYEEKNDYYRMLAGLPPYETKVEDFILVPQGIRATIHLTRMIDNIPIHLMERNDQNLIMQESWFTELLTLHPDKDYLRYLGSRSIDPVLARMAKDFELIRYFSSDAGSDLNPYMLKEFGSLYNEYRDYVMLTLYNRELENVFTHYRPFMSLLIILFVINQICLRTIEHCIDYRFLDDKIISTIFQMYGISKDLIILMTPKVQRELVTSLLKLIRKKATNPVFYDLVKILGYTNINISKLMMMKQQYFDEETGQTYFSDGTPINSFQDLDKILQIDETGKPLQEIGLSNLLPIDDPLEEKVPFRGLPFFRAIDLRDSNPYQTLIDEDALTYDYFSMTENDPRWWDDQETRDLVRNKNYTSADSKYIMIEAVLHESAYLYEVIYFMRLILDNQKRTSQFFVSIPELFGNNKVSLFDLMTFLLAAMAHNSGFQGNILTSASGLLAIAGFNFELDLAKFREFLNGTEYVDKEKTLEYLEGMAISNPGTIRTVFEDLMIPFRDWLTSMMVNTTSHKEYVEYEAVFRATFSYDIAQQVFVHDFLIPEEAIKIKYHISDRELLEFKLFYPHDHTTGKALTVEEFNGSLYDPFIGALALTKTWYVDTGLGYLYFYDVLNSRDLRYVLNEAGEQIPNPVFWDNQNGVYDGLALEKAIGRIRQLPGNHLASAFFVCNTPIPGDDNFIPGIQYDSNGNPILIHYLPQSIRLDEVFKNILIDKIEADLKGEALPPKTYREYLARRNPMVESLFQRADQESQWKNIIMIIVLAIESEANLFLKAFEQSVAGNEMYFKSLITLIKYFKSYMIDFARTSIKFVFDAKIDPGGTSNMLKIFDEIEVNSWHLEKDEEVGLYDTERRVRHYWNIEDRSDMITPEGIKKREGWMGSLRLVDEAKFFINGQDEDPVSGVSIWYAGESDIGRFDMEHDRRDATYDHTQRTKAPLVDTEYWKFLVESYLPPEE